MYITTYNLNNVALDRKKTIKKISQISKLKCVKRTELSALSICVKTTFNLH